MVARAGSAAERLSAALAPEGRRYLVATGVGSAVSLTVVLVAGIRVRTLAEYLLAVGVQGLLGLSVWCLVYVLVTLAVFLPAPPSRLPGLLETRPLPLWRRVLRGGSDGPVVAVQFAALALVAAALLPRLDEAVPGVGRVPVAALCTAAVVLCWAALTTTYAVHYMRLHLRGGGLRFTGADEVGFSDFCYVAVAVATTFSTTDVEVTEPAVRRVVSGHAVLAFLFNGVILALLLTALAA